MSSSEDGVFPSTFSIVARCPNTQQWGVAVQSKFLGVGWMVPWAEWGVGAVATQAWGNPTFGPRGLELMRRGAGAEEALARLISEDREAERRQVALVDAAGDTAAYTGSGCSAWAGHLRGPGHSCQGNILAGPEVVHEMSRAYLAASGQLADRLIQALHAGQAAGGDIRGQQSAALVVVSEWGGYGGLDHRYADSRVDDHPEPIGELERIWTEHKIIFRKTSDDDLVPWQHPRVADLARHLGVTGAVDGPGEARSRLEQVLRDGARERGLAEVRLDAGIDGRLWRRLDSW